MDFVWKYPIVFAILQEEPSSSNCLTILQSRLLRFMVWTHHVETERKVYMKSLLTVQEVNRQRMKT